jgi:hypothetical protein
MVPTQTATVKWNPSGLSSNSCPLARDGGTVFAKNGSGYMKTTVAGPFLQLLKFQTKTADH